MLIRPLSCLFLLGLGASQPLACAQSPKPVAPPDSLSGPAQLPWLDSLLTAAPALRQHQVGLSLLDAGTGEVLYGHEADKYFSPASTMKLVSLYAGLHLLGDSLPSLRYFSRGDTLFFQGTGDPTFLHGDVPSRRAYDFLVRRPEKLLAYCDRPCAAAYGPSWAWDDYGYYFQSERTAFPVFGNTVRFYASPPRPSSPGERGENRKASGFPLPRKGAGGEAAQPVRVLPRFFAPLTFPIPEGETAGLDPDVHVRRDPLDNRFRYLSTSKKWVDEVPYRTSRGLLLHLLGDTLRRGIVGTLWRPRPGRDTIRTLAGLPVDSLYRRMLRVSDNFLAEQLLLMGAARLGRGDSLSTYRVIQHARRNFLTGLPDPVVWVDGSGLSRLNLLTPRTLAQLLCRLHQEVPEPRLLGLLAPGGGQGTLRRRYFDAGPPKTSWLWGKTGTLTHTCNLAGYLRTRSGRLLAVVFFNNNVPGDDQATRNEMQRLLGEVRQRL